MTDATLSRMRMLPLTLAALFLAAPAAAQEPSARYAKELAAFDAADAARPPLPGGIVLVGSSTIVDWDPSKYFPDLPVLNRGLWGSSVGDLVRFAERLVLAYQPRLVVVYSGDNDIDGGRTSEDVIVDLERFVKSIHARLPQTRIVFIGIKPSPLRWLTIDRMRAANAMIRALSTRDDRIAFLDVDGVMMGWDEKPRRELYLSDGLHLSPQGYQLWTTLLRPLLAP